MKPKPEYHITPSTDYLGNATGQWDVRERTAHTDLVVSPCDTREQAEEELAGFVAVQKADEILNSPAARAAELHAMPGDFDMAGPEERR